MKIDDDVVTRDGFGKILGFYGDQIMVHVKVGKRYSAYRMYSQKEVKPA